MTFLCKALNRTLHNTRFDMEGDRVIRLFKSVDSFIKVMHGFDQR